MHHIDFTAFMENPDKAWMEIKERERSQMHCQNRHFLIRWAYFVKNLTQNQRFLGFGHEFYVVLVFAGQQ
jgi:hypothetical protein